MYFCMYKTLCLCRLKGVCLGSTFHLLQPQFCRIVWVAKACQCHGFSSLLPQEVMLKLQLVTLVAVCPEVLFSEVLWKPLCSCSEVLIQPTEFTCKVHDWRSQVNTDLTANSHSGRFSNGRLISSIVLLSFSCMFCFTFYTGNTDSQPLWWRQKHWKMLMSFFWGSPYSIRPWPAWSCSSSVLHQTDRAEVVCKLGCLTAI